MKRILFIVAAALILTACDDKEDNKIQLELEFIKAEDNKDKGLIAIYVCHDEEKYYRQSISPYEYNNYYKKDIETGETIRAVKDLGSEYEWFFRGTISYDFEINGEVVELVEYDYIE